MTAGDVRAAVVVIGNEILSGRTQDINLQYIATGLNEVGVRLAEARVVADDETAIIAAVNELRAKYDYVFTTGGIGPTHDDITAECMAKAFGVPLIRDPRAVARISRQANTTQHNEARLRMANMPEGSELIDNPVSGAPGFKKENVFVMAGIPRVMQAMFDGVRHNLKGGKRMLSKSVAVFLGESVIAAGLTAIQERFADLEIGSYPFSRQGVFGTSIVSRGTEAQRIVAASQEVAALVADLGGRCEDDGQAPH